MSGPETLLYEYASRMDAGDFEGVADLFRNGAIFTADGTEVARGYDAVLKLYRGTTRLHEDGTPKTKHVVSNVVVHAADDGRSATVDAYFTVVQATEKIPLQVIIAGRYVDRVVDDGERWTFAERIMHLDLIGDVSDHLFIDLHAD